MCITLKEVKETIETGIKLALSEQIKPDLQAIKIQTTATNGRVTKLELAQQNLEREMQVIKDNLSLHPTNCPYAEPVRKLQDDAISNSAVKAILWKGVGIIISFMALGLTALGFILG